MRAFLAGIAIGIGGAVYLISGVPWLFAVGLLIVLIGDLHLYTGIACFSEDYKRLLYTLFYNLLGAILAACFVGAMHPALIPVAQSIIAAKLVLSPIEIFERAILCNILIYLAVRSYRTWRFGWLLTILCVGLFVIFGLDHCIADTFYCALGQNLSPHIIVPAILGNSFGAAFMYRLHFKNDLP